MITRHFKAAALGLLMAGSLAGCGPFAHKSISAEVNDAHDTLNIVMDNASPSDETEIGIVPVGKGETLFVKSSLRRGSVNVVFENGIKRVSATLPVGTTEGKRIGNLEGSWSITVKPLEEDTAGDVKVYKKEGVDDSSDMRSTTRFVSSETNDVIEMTSGN